MIFSKMTETLRDLKCPGRSKLCEVMASETIMYLKRSSVLLYPRRSNSLDVVPTGSPAKPHRHQLLLTSVGAGAVFEVTTQFCLE